ncbi:hypothetical protein BS47DRAFT_1368481 [Hydnum rufescens UP504]|uniref:Uncharacterized protein n=1 Tax=Hydnum rufescens UP504 TaxID=1448309 RepID=A0A9P6AFI0_9AGAM|nr:hypothetical protein BS47DRAFT_1368481 [Hydnum rufescens UP504]
MVRTTCVLRKKNGLPGRERVRPGRPAPGPRIGADGQLRTRHHQIRVKLEKRTSIHQHIPLLYRNWAWAFFLGHDKVSLETMSSSGPSPGNMLLGAVEQLCQDRWRRSVMKEASRRSRCIHRREDHIYAIPISQHVRRPQKHNESCDWKLQYGGCVKPGHVLRLVRERYEGMEEQCDNISKETWDLGLIDALKACAANLRKCRCVRWPWLLPSEKITGHELERIPDTSSMAWVFINPCPIAPHASRGNPPGAANPQVQSWEPQVYANTPVLYPEWEKLERPGVSDDWVGGVNENGMGEGLDLIHKVL